MADERFKPDADFKAGGAVGGYSSADAIGATSPTLIVLRLDPTTGRLLIDSNTGQVEDTAHASGDVGVMSLAVRNDVVASLVSDDGDYSPLQVNSVGSLYTTPGNFVSTNNSRTTVLGAGAVFTGTADDCHDYACVSVMVDASHDSAAGGLSIQFSQDGTNWDETHAHTFDVSVTPALSVIYPVHARYFRVVYTNGGTLQTHFRLQSILHASPLTAEAHRLGDSESAEESGVLMKSVVLAQGAGIGLFVPVQSTAGGNLKISLEEASDGMDIGAGNAGSETLRVSVATDDVNLAAIKTAVEAATPAGTNVIGKVRLVTATGDEVTEDTDNSVQVTIVADDVGIGGGTQYTEDVATANPQVGNAIMVERDDQLAAVTPVEGDWIGLRGTEKGALWVALADASGDPITAFGGGTEYTEDVATANPQVGKAIMVERDDALAEVTPVEGDWIGLRGTAEGALWTQDFNSDALLADTNAMVVDLAAIEVLLGTIDTDTGAMVTDLAAIEVLLGTIDTDTGAMVTDLAAIEVLLGTIDADTGAIKTAVELIDNPVAVLGTATYTEATTSGFIIGAVRNDALAALADTDNEIAPLQVNTEGALYVAGGVAHDAADSGESIKIGGRAQDIIGAEPEEVSADNDRVDALFDMSGRLGVTAGYDFKYADINDAVSGDNSIIAAQAAGKRIAVWAILIVSDGTVDVRWEDGTGGTAFTGQVPLQAREGYSISAGGLVPLFVGSAATLLNLELSAAINVHGFVSWTIMED